MSVGSRATLVALLALSGCLSATAPTAPVESNSTSAPATGAGEIVPLPETATAVPPPPIVLYLTSTRTLSFSLPEAGTFPETFGVSDPDAFSGAEQPPPWIVEAALPDALLVTAAKIDVWFS